MGTRTNVIRMDMPYIMVLVESTQILLIKMLFRTDRACNRATRRYRTTRRTIVQRQTLRKYKLLSVLHRIEINVPNPAMIGIVVAVQGVGSLNTSLLFQFTMVKNHVSFVMKMD